jgi:DNA (cytosine-5)-methyltransferase 1
MIEYYLKFNSKNLKSNINKLMLEIETILDLDNIEIEISKEVFYEKVKNIISEKQYLHLCNLLFTLKKNRHKNVFFEKYFKPKVEDKSRKFAFADLFAGCGGLSLGLEQAGFNGVFVNEIDEVFAETHYFNHNIPVSNYFVGDINELVSDFSKAKVSLKNLDLVCGGPPCQGFSMANRQRVIDDPRNGLYKSYLKFLHETKPKFFIMENVKGMANKIDEILNDFNSYLDNEYNIHYSIFNAKDFGLPQNRERFFIIGNRVGIDTKSIFNDIKNDKAETKFVLKNALKDLPILKPKNIKNNNDIENKDFGFYITQQKTSSNKYLDFINNSRKINYVFNHKNRYNNERDIEIYGKLPQGENSLHHSIANIMPYSSRNHMFKDKYYKLDETKVCKTITSHMKFDCNMYIHPTQSRGLSAREASRVQTFPDDFLLRGSQNKWYAQVGNAVPVKLAEIIGKHIIKHL